MLCCSAHVCSRAFTSVLARSDCGSSGTRRCIVSLTGGSEPEPPAVPCLGWSACCAGPLWGCPYGLADPPRSPSWPAAFPPSGVWPAPAAPPRRPSCEVSFGELCGTVFMAGCAQPSAAGFFMWSTEQVLCWKVVVVGCARLSAAGPSSAQPEYIAIHAHENT